MKIFKRVLAVLAITGCAGAANAGLITITDEAAITTSAQTFVYNFAGVDIAAGTDAVFTLYGRGDFTINASSGDGEWATFDIDALVSGLAHPRIGIITTEHSLQDVSFSADFSILNSVMLAILLDNALQITLATSQGVDIIDSNSLLGFSLSYESSDSAVPAPATLALLGLGLAGLGWSRRKKA